MARIDYVNDPHAPRANSVVPSVVAIVRDEHGRVLMIHKTDNDKWALPGGGHEIGESIADTVVREVKEETGYDVEVDTLTGTYTNPGQVMAYDDGEVRQQFSLVSGLASWEVPRPPAAKVTKSSGSPPSRSRSWTYTPPCASASPTPSHWESGQSSGNPAAQPATRGLDPWSVISNVMTALLSGSTSGAASSRGSRL